MALAPFRDRTITLSLETDVQATNKNGSALAANAALTNRFLPQSGVLGTLAKTAGIATPAVTLKGVTHIAVSNTIDIGEDSGVETSFLQGWFIKPVKISLRGQSNLGAYPLLTPSDGDVAKTLAKLRTAANDFSGRYGAPGTRSRFYLEFRGYPAGARKHLGFLRELSWTEDIKQPNLLDYSISFVGVNVDGASLAKGKAGSAASKKVANGNG